MASAAKKSRVACLVLAAFCAAPRAHGFAVVVRAPAPAHDRARRGLRLQRFSSSSDEQPPPPPQQPSEEDVTATTTTATSATEQMVDEICKEMHDDLAEFRANLRNQINSDIDSMVSNLKDEISELNVGIRDALADADQAPDATLDDLAPGAPRRLPPPIQDR